MSMPMPRMGRPEFLNSRYVEDDKTRKGLHWVVSDNAPEDVRRELQRQIDEWEQAFEDARKQGIYL